MLIAGLLQLGPKGEPESDIMLGKGIRIAKRLNLGIELIFKGLFGVPHLIGEVALRNGSELGMSHGV